MSTGSKGGTTAAGIVEDAKTKGRIIPQSRRPDGSIRKERKVKPGFVPVEDVARFVPSRVRQARADAAGSKKPPTTADVKTTVIKMSQDRTAEARSAVESEATVSQFGSSRRAVDAPSWRRPAQLQSDSKPNPTPSKDSQITVVPDSWDDEVDGKLSNDISTTKIPSIDTIADDLSSLAIDKSSSQNK